MGRSKLFELLVVAVAAAAVAASGAGSGSGAGLPCTLGRQFWDERRGGCLPCSQCPDGQVVLAPCAVHRDTDCGPISKLMIDWSWLPRRSNRTAAAPSHRHHHHHHHHHKSHQHGDGWSSSSEVDSSAFSSHSEEHEEDSPRPTRRRQAHRHHSRWSSSSSSSSSFAEESSYSSSMEDGIGTFNRTSSLSAQRRNKTSQHRKHGSGGRKHGHHAHSRHREEHRHRNFSSGHHLPDARKPLLPESAAQLKEDSAPQEAAPPAQATQRPHHGQPQAQHQHQQQHQRPQPFSTAETLVWDWQVVVLALAVCACLLFFLVTGIYSIHHARQWRRLKDNFEADMEELSAQLSLMSPAVAAAAAAAAASEPTAGSVAPECSYLEQLLVHKQQSEPLDVHGNVYIDGNSHRV